SQAVSRVSSSRMRVSALSRSRRSLAFSSRGLSRSSAVQSPVAGFSTVMRPILQSTAFRCPRSAVDTGQNLRHGLYIYSEAPAQSTWVFEYPEAKQRTSGVCPETPAENGFFVLPILRSLCVEMSEVCAEVSAMTAFRLAKLLEVSLHDALQVRALPQPPCSHCGCRPRSKLSRP